MVSWKWAKRSFMDYRKFQSRTEVDIHGEAIRRFLMHYRNEWRFLEEQMNEVYNSPEIPGFMKAKASFTEVA